MGSEEVTASDLAAAVTAEVEEGKAVETEDLREAETVVAVDCSESNCHTSCLPNA